MTMSRRKAIGMSGSTLAGLSLSTLTGRPSKPRPASRHPPWPETLVERPRREGFPAPLPLNADGSAPEHPESAAGPITDPLLWRTPNRQPPEIDYDYRKMAIKVDTRGLGEAGRHAALRGPREAAARGETYLLQCGAPNPRGIVKWTGVRFSDFADMLGMVPGVHYARFIASDRFYVDETWNADASAGDAGVADERPADSPSTARRCG